ncbi:MAG: MaoC/PaaZ C-terminal domain-containing protein [Acidimicrobiales bacterium]|jgi:acyl dehydratase
MALQRSQLVVGMVYEQVVVSNLTRTQLVQYAGASGDYNPLHSDEIFASEVAHHPTVFAHGMLTMGLTSKMVTDVVGDGRLVRFGGRFHAIVWPGDDLTSRAEVAEIIESDFDLFADLAITTVNQNGEKVFSGHALARIDP